MTTSPFVATISIIEDPAYTSGKRSYSLIDREFFLHEPNPVETESKWMDGTKFKAKYYVVSIKEYVRVVPEALEENAEWGKFVLIPIYYAHRSFKPCYAK